ncbi:MAG: tol-pal system protein YbgF [Methylococcaceae bacterium]|nr:tol-pal system protein YbgF [Methylococcaceae bacterium]
MKKFSLACLLTVAAPAYAELPAVIDHSAYPPSAKPVSPVNAPSSTALYDALKRVDQLQAEVQQLTGKVDELVYRNDELKKQIKTMYSDFDERVQSLETKASGTEEQAVADGTAEVVNTEANDPNAAAPTAPAPDAAAGDTAAPADTPAPAAAPSEPAEVPQPMPTEAAASATPAPAPAPAPEMAAASATEKQVYQQAYNELRNGHTDPSIEQFKSYLSTYPEGAYANNAQYWLGEAYRVKQDNDAARLAFNTVINNYPNGSKVPDALLKLGYLEIELKNISKAREYLTRVTTDYPKSPAAQLAAKKLLKLDQAKN